MATRKPASLTGPLIGEFVRGIEAAMDEGGICTERQIRLYLLKHRSRSGPLRLSPTQITWNLQMMLDKMTSSGRIGVAYYRKGATNGK